MLISRGLVLLVSIGCGWLAACHDARDSSTAAPRGLEGGTARSNELDGAAYRAGADTTADADSPAGDVAPFPDPAGANAPADAGVVSLSDELFHSAPGQPASPQQAFAITFDPPGGGFSEAFELRLSALLPASVIHYTLDGSLPSADSPVYDEPIPVSATTLVRAVAARASDSSPIINQSYVRLDPAALDVDSNLPIVVVHMLGKAPPAAASRDFVGAVFAVFEPRAGRARLNGAATWTGRLGVKVRGRSSRRQPKANYTLEIRGDDEEDLPIPLLGMPREGDWVLYAPYVFDRSLVRNALMYELSRRIGRYAPRTRFCELYFVANHADLQAADYAGVYVLTERLTRGDERIDVHKLEPSGVDPSAVTGGYVVKVDEPDVPGDAFSAADRTFVYVDPPYDEVAPEQTAYLTEYLDSWYRAISADDGVDPLTGNAFDALMDIPSFVDHHILNMFGKNPDAFALSAYYHKDRSGPLQAGPLWDMDLGLGNVDDPYKGLRRSFEPTGWGPMLGHTLFTRTPYADLFKHPEFTEAYWTRWEELLASTLTTDTVKDVFAGYATELAEAELRNRTRWPEMAPASGSFEAELDVLGSWVEARLEWIRTQIGVFP